MGPDDVTPDAPQPRHLDDKQLLFAVLGVLGLHHAAHPKRAVDVRSELAKLRIVATPEQIAAALQSCLRRGLDVVEQADGKFMIRGWPVPRPTIGWVSSE